LADADNSVFGIKFLFLFLRVLSMENLPSLVVTSFLLDNLDDFMVGIRVMPLVFLRMAALESKGCLGMSELD